jgi:adenylate cyclase
LCISGQLIKVADDTHLWAETYNRDWKDVFDIQEEVSKAISPVYAFVVGDI